MKKLYSLVSLKGDVVGIACWNSEEAEKVRKVYKRQGILIVEKLK
jgi:hypothetical protein